MSGLPTPIFVGWLLVLGTYLLLKPEMAVLYVFREKEGVSKWTRIINRIAGMGFILTGVFVVMTIV